MTMKMYINNNNLVAGMTLQDTSCPEHNNMALHACIEPSKVIKNRQKLAEFLQIDVSDFVCANQTHSANFRCITASDKGSGSTDSESAIPHTDALYTYEPGIMLGSFTADCVPVLFYNEKIGLIGAIHSGWQGTVKEITLKLFEHLSYNEQVNMSDVHVHIGSALSQKKFEVDEDVYLKFKALGYADDFIRYETSTQKYHIDNQKTVQQQCEHAGIPLNQITIDPTCTLLSPNGFSYRQDKKAGRHLSFIMRK